LGSDDDDDDDDDNAAIGFQSSVGEECQSRFFASSSWIEGVVKIRFVRGTNMGHESIYAEPDASIKKICLRKVSLCLRKMSLIYAAPISVRGAICLDRYSSILCLIGVLKLGKYDLKKPL
jgi:hypothetical protein